MARKIIWTPEAEKSLSSVVDYLSQNWTDKEIRTFLRKVNEIVEHIGQYPSAFRTSGKYDIREAVVTEHNILLYRVSTKSIYIIYFWDTRKNPARKPI